MGFGLKTPSGCTVFPDEDPVQKKGGSADIEIVCGADSNIVVNKDGNTITIDVYYV